LHKETVDEKHCDGKCCNEGCVCSDQSLAPCKAIAEKISHQLKGWHQHQIFHDRFARFIFMRWRVMITLLFDCREGKETICIDTAWDHGVSHEEFMGINEKNAELAIERIIARVSLYESMKKF